MKYYWLIFSDTPHVSTMPTITCRPKAMFCVGYGADRKIVDHERGFARKGGGAMAIRAVTAILIGSMAFMVPPATARRYHGFHAHRSGNFGGRPHCRTYRDRDGRRERVCV